MPDEIRERAISMLDPDAVNAVQEQITKESRETAEIVVESSETTDDVSPAPIEKSGTGAFHTMTGEHMGNSTSDSRFDDIKATGYEIEDVSESEEALSQLDDLDQSRQTIRMKERMNNKLMTDGKRKRYPTSRNDLPEDWPVFENEIGKYYYKIDDRLRPSDIDGVDNMHAWKSQSIQPRAVATTALIKRKYPDLCDELITSDRMDIEKAVESMLVTAEEEVNDDTFACNISEKITDVLSRME